MLQIILSESPNLVARTMTISAGNELVVSDCIHFVPCHNENAHPFPDESQTDHCPRGGDILVADSETVLVGVSQRTNEKLGGIFRTWQNHHDQSMEGIGSLRISKRV